MIGPNGPRNDSPPGVLDLWDFHPDDWALIEAFANEGCNVLALIEVADADAGTASNDGGGE